MWFHSHRYLFFKNVVNYIIMKKLVAILLLVLGIMYGCSAPSHEPSGTNGAAWEIASQSYSQFIFATSAAQITQGANFWNNATDSTTKDSIANAYFSNYLIRNVGNDTIAIVGLATIVTYGKSLADTTWQLVYTNEMNWISLYYDVKEIASDSLSVLATNSAESCAITMTIVNGNTVDDFVVSGNGVGIEIVNLYGVSAADFTLPQPIHLVRSSTLVNGGYLSYSPTGGQMDLNLYNQTIYVAGRDITVVFGQS